MKRNIYTKRYGQWLCWEHFSFQTSISCVNRTCCCATVADFSICFLQLFTDISLTHRSSLVNRTIHYSKSTLTRAAPKLHFRYEWWYAVCTRHNHKRAYRKRRVYKSKEIRKRRRRNNNQPTNLNIQYASVLCM